VLFNEKLAVRESIKWAKKNSPARKRQKQTKRKKASQTGRAALDLSKPKHF